jgi:hypothetical protein
MLRLQGGQVEALWDELLPIAVRELPEDLAGLDRVLADEALLAPVVRLWERQWPKAVGRGRPEVPRLRWTLGCPGRGCCREALEVLRA